MNLIPPAFHQFCQPPISPPSSESLKWVISRGAEKKGKSVPGWKSRLVCEQQKTWILFIYMAGRPYQFASDEGICCKLGTIAPCLSCPRLLASRAQHMKCLFDESRSHSCQSSRAVLTGQSWCLLIERLDLAELDLVQKIAATRESGRKLRDGHRQRWRLVLKLVRSYRLLLWWHLWLLRDFRE